MTFVELRAFIEKRMRMAHIYQPVMLMTLLRGRGACTDEKIAKSILLFDESQIDYYNNITNNMVGRVLRRHGVVEKEVRTMLHPRRCRATGDDVLLMSLSGRSVFGISS